VLVALDLRFILWLVFQSHYPHLPVWLWQSSVPAAATDGYILLLVGMAFFSILMQLFLLMNVLTVSEHAWPPGTLFRWNRIRGCG